MKISIVTPSLNQARFIGRTIASVANQQGVDLEHVVVDGGSTDGTLDILRGLGTSVRWVSEPDRGQSHAINKGIHDTDGEIVGWLNSDDVYLPGALRHVVKSFSSLPGVDVVYGMANHINEEGEPFEAYPTRAWDFNLLRERCFICQPAAFLRRTALDRFGDLNEALHYCMDYEYWLRLGMGGAKFAYLERFLAESRMYPENKTLRDRVALHQEVNDMFRYLFGHVPDRWILAYAYVKLKSGALGSDSPFLRPFLWLREVGRASRQWNGSVPLSLGVALSRALGASLERSIRTFAG